LQQDSDAIPLCADVMVKYGREPENTGKSAKARASDLRTSFKNMRETAMAIKGMELSKARNYLGKVLEKKDVIPLRRFSGSAGRSALCKNHNHYGPGRFPEKSVKHLLDLLTNAESNAEVKSLDTDNLTITHIQVLNTPAAILPPAARLKNRACRSREPDPARKC